jgi:hypothetical protein
MGDVEDMIGTLEDEDDEDQAEPAPDDGEDGDEGAFGLDLDSAWRSPGRDDD